LLLGAYAASVVAGVLKLLFLLKEQHCVLPTVWRISNPASHWNCWCYRIHIVYYYANWNMWLYLYCCRRHSKVGLTLWIMLSTAETWVFLRTCIVMSLMLPCWLRDVVSLFTVQRLR